MTKYASSIVAVTTIAAVTALGWTGNLSSTDTLAALTAMLTLIGGLGVLVVGSTQPNSNALPHALLAVAILAALTVLGIHGTLTSNQLAVIFAGIIPVGAVVAGNVSASGSSPTTTGQVN